MVKYNRYPLKKKKKLKRIYSVHYIPYYIYIHKSIFRDETELLKGYNGTQIG